MKLKESIKGNGKAVLNLCIHPNKTRSLFPAGYDEWRGCIEVHITEETKKGCANKELISILAEFFEVPKDSIAILSGKTSREKIVEIGGISKTTAIKRIKGVLNEL